MHNPIYIHALINVLHIEENEVTLLLNAAHKSGADLEKFVLSIIELKEQQEQR